MASPGQYHPQGTTPSICPEKEYNFKGELSVCQGEPQQLEDSNEYKRNHGVCMSLSGRPHQNPREQTSSEKRHSGAIRSLVVMKGPLL